jgi:hypothetical protein
MKPLRRLSLSALLAVVYLLLVTPVGAVVRLFADPLERRPDPSATSYWTYRRA